MLDNWILSPQYFERHEPALADIVPDATSINGPYDIHDRSTDSLALIYKPIKEFTQNTISANSRPVSISGECCTAIPVLAGVQASGIEPTLVWIDAHADFNAPETSPSQFLGGMPLAMIVGRGPQSICDAVGLMPLSEKNVWLIDGRDLDPLERASLDASAVRRTGMSGLATLRIDGPVHLHLDIDVIDAAEAPANNYPVPNGPSVAETVAACNAFATANEIVAVSVSGWTGKLDTDGRTKEACKKVLQSILV